jgi:hypothetical protein
METKGTKQETKFSTKFPFGKIANGDVFGLPKGPVC